MARRYVAGCAAALLAVLAGAGIASARGVQSYCAAAKQPMAKDAQLRGAARAVFPAAELAERNDDCLYPTKVLRYDEADVLIVAGGAPGEACHGCAASLSAYVIRRAPGASRVVARFVDFATSGTFGDPGRIGALQLAGHDAFAIKAGGTFQGYTASTLTLFVFANSRLVELKPALHLAADNGGAVTDDRKAISIEGSWQVDPSRPGTVTVAYRIREAGRERQAGATWVVRGTALKLIAGRIPHEYAAAGGG